MDATTDTATAPETATANDTATAWETATAPDTTPDRGPDAEPSPGGAESDSASCADSVDNDLDGHTDCRDTDCAGVGPCQPETGDEACTDRFDNDLDGYTDCKDFDCGGSGQCGSEDTAERCRDDLDNDGDGYLDCHDFDCRAFPPCGDEDNEAVCSDGFDNDGDGHTDCRDFGCGAVSPCSSGEAGACADGIDNDGDGYADCADSDCAPGCGTVKLRVATWNVKSIGSQDSEAFAALRAIVSRIDADILCLQEVEAWEGYRLERLARLAGYGHWFQGWISTGMAGGLVNACLSRFPFAEASSRSSDDISNDPSANETGRDIVKVGVEVRQGRSFVTVFNVHLKSGFGAANKLRRQVEAERLGQVVDQAEALRPGEPVVAVGDFNEEIDSGALGGSITSPPADLPSTYSLGSDLAYPFVYDPFAVLSARGLDVAHPRREDSWMDDTRIPSGRRIDFVLARGATILDGEVYDACDDDGVDADPPGGRLEKAGEPVACGLSGIASDHRPVVVELLLP